MTLAEFDSKPLTTNADAVAAIKDSTFDALRSYIADGEESRVTKLLNGLWLSRPAFTKEQMLEAAVDALFPRKGYMRCAASVTAMKLAKASGSEPGLQRIVQERWCSLNERGCNEVVLGLSGYDDVDGWLPVLPSLFESNKSNDVRTALVRVVNNIVRAKEQIGRAHV